MDFYKFARMLTCTFPDKDIEMIDESGDSQNLRELKCIHSMELVRRFARFMNPMECHIFTTSCTFNGIAMYGRLRSKDGDYPMIISIKEGE